MPIPLGRLDPLNWGECERSEPGRVIGGRRYLSGPLIRHLLAHAFESSGLIKVKAGSGKTTGNPPKPRAQSDVCLFPSQIRRI